MLALATYNLEGLLQYHIHGNNPTSIFFNTSLFKSAENGSRRPIRFRIKTVWTEVARKVIGLGMRPPHFGY